MEINISKSYNVDKLRTWLGYELSTMLLFLLSSFWALALILTAIAAVLFTPFMLKILIEERRFGWIIFFLIIVGTPLLLLMFVDSYAFVLQYAALGMFYFYCFILRFAIRDWE